MRRSIYACMKPYMKFWAISLMVDATMQGLIERYMKCSRRGQPEPAAIETQPDMDAKEEINKLKQEIEVLQKGLRYMFGGNAAEMSLDELIEIEKHLENWIDQIRSIKMDIMLKEIQLLRNKEGILKAANQYLQDKVGE
ncbi:hypothetical protein DKX38_019956 [Salix brachista]|uniref:K-box domain-containing protein n=1 Tax=Salix brachista TaxID=2182728 RepID=A0A5N5KHQ2_9ROSI|nr:hypothetical protein DKX38_019956 [Salix brachista]